MVVGSKVHVRGGTLLWVVALVVLFAASPAAGTIAPHSSTAARSGPSPLSAAELRSGPYEAEGGSSFPALSTATDLGALPASQSIYFTVSFDPTNTAGISALIQAQQTPGGPLYHHFLTAAQFDQLFGPAPGVASETTQYFTSYGATPVATHSPFTVAFRATPVQIGSALRTSLQSYRLTNGSVGFANAMPLSLPSSIGRYVSSVDGLASFQAGQPEHLQAPSDMVGGAGVATRAASGPVAEAFSEAANWSQPGFVYSPAGQIGPSAYQFLTPAAMTVAYNATGLYALGDYGQGSTIAVVMASGYNPSDLATYANETFGNPNQILDRLTPYPVAGIGGNASPPGTSFLTNGDAFEFTLDIEYSATMAPRAHIDAVYGPGLDNPSVVSDYALIANLNPVPNVITNSWGGSEDAWWNLNGPSWQSATAMENYWEQITAEGGTIIASTGDDSGWDAETGDLSIGIPASSPYVMGIGGVQTTDGNAAGVEFPAAQYTVNQTLAIYGWTQAGSPLWFPNETLNGSDAGPAVNESYWVTPTSPNGETPNYGGGTMGLSYWFTQPWWQHGLAVPDTGRRMNPDISAEANYNESLYFGGAWDFFWGGTSFACPTVAGELALLDTYLNTTLGPTFPQTSFYSGLLGPLLYSLGNDANLTRSAYAQITQGQNLWDLTALSQGFEFPPGQNWPVSYVNATPGWNLLAGWGVPNVGNLARDAATIDDPSMVVTFANGTVVTTAPAGVNYTLTLDNSPFHFPVGHAPVQMWFSPSSLTPGAPVETTQVTSNFGGHFYFNATTSGYLAIYAQNGGRTTFQSIWFSPAAASGTLKVAVVNAPPTMMGGFEEFNGFLSSPYPGLGPIQPNILTVQVTWQATPTSAPVPVYDAQVLASSPTGIDFSSPPDVENPEFNSSLLPASPLASLSLTNLTGIAYVDTWNEPTPANLTINATYEGLSASTEYTVTPQLNVGGVGPVESFLSILYGSIPGYIGLGAQDTILAPSVSGGATYELPVLVTNWTGAPLADTVVDLALPPYAPPYGITPLPGTAAVTNSEGVANLTINANLAALGADFGGELLVEAYNSSYGAVTTTTALGEDAFVSNASAGALLFVGPASSSIQMWADYGAVPTNYVGTTGAAASFDVSVPAPTGFYAYNNLTSLTYQVDDQAPVAVPLGSVGQTSYAWTADLATLALGSHNLTVTFTDAMGFTYTDVQQFWAIGAGADPAPGVSFVTPASGAYLSGDTTVSWSSNETAYLIDEELTVSDGAYQATYDVTGATSFVLSTAGLATGPVDLSITVTNPNGLTGTNATTFNVGSALTPTASISAPADGAKLLAGANVTVAFAYSGDYLSSETLVVTSPAGAGAPIDVAGTSSYVILDVVAGSYSLALTVTSSDGQTAEATTSFTVAAVPPPPVVATLTSVTVSPSTDQLAFNGAVTLTATAICSPSPCPSGVTWTWTSSASAVAAVTASSAGAATATVQAASTAGTALITAMATLNGHSLNGSAAITVATSTSVTTSSTSTTNYALWGGLVVVVAIVGFVLGALIFRGRGGKGPSPSSTANPAWSETPKSGASPPASGSEPPK